MQKVLITGCAGFIGHHLARKLTGMGYDTVGIDNLTTGLRRYSDLVNDFIWDDVGYLTAEDLKGFDWVFHLAAQPSIPISIAEPMRTNDVNINQTLSLLIAARDAGVKKFIFSSSSSVYGGQKKYPSNEEDRVVPLTPYALQKLTAEMYCEVFRTIYGLPTVSLRYFNVFGEEQRADNPYTGVLTKFLRMKNLGHPLTIFGDGTQTRDFTYIDDVISANLITAESGEGVYNVGTGRNVSVNEIATAISDQVEYLPARPGDPMTSLADNGKLRELGWSPETEILTWLNSQLN